MTSEPSLLDMPDVVMKTILGDCEFSPILTLRKVCHTLRNFIDDVKPDSRLTSMYITVAWDEANIFSQSSSKRNYVSFESFEEGSYIRFKNTGKVIKNVEFTDVFSKNLEILLQLQKSTLNHFSWIWVKSPESFMTKDREGRTTQITTFVENVKKTLKTHQFKVKEFLLHAENLDEIMSILPFINPEELERITILNTDGRSGTLDLEEIMKLGHWKQAKRLEISNIYALAPIQSFLHFEVIYVTLPSISSIDLDVVKQAFLTSSTPRDFTFHFPEFIDRENIANLWGPPAVQQDNNEEVDYYFPIPLSEKYLNVDIDTDYVSFSRVSEEDIPPSMMI